MLPPFLRLSQTPSPSPASPMCPCNADRSSPHPRSRRQCRLPVSTTPHASCRLVKHRCIRTNTPFNPGALTVHGLHDRRLLNFRTVRGRNFHIAFDTHNVNDNGWGNGGGRTVPVQQLAVVPSRSPLPTRVRRHRGGGGADEPGVAPEGPVVTAQPAYDRITGPHHRLDVQVTLLGDENLRPHGILGQSLMATTVRLRPLDVYPDSRSQPSSRRGDAEGHRGCSVRLRFILIACHGVRLLRFESSEARPGRVARRCTSHAPRTMGWTNHGHRIPTPPAVGDPMSLSVSVTAASSPWCSTT